MVEHEISSILSQLKSNETYTRNNAIKKIIKEKINDEQIIIALKDVVENDASLSARNFARNALDILGIEHSAIETEVLIQNTSITHLTVNNGQNINESITTTEKILFAAVAVIAVIIACFFLLFNLWMDTMM